MHKLKDYCKNQFNPLELICGDDNCMTCLINVKNDKFACLAADTLNYNGKANKFIHKIACNKENGIMIGSSGTNGIIQGDFELTVYQIMEYATKIYNGTNISHIECFLESLSYYIMNRLEENTSLHYIINYIENNIIQQKY